MISIRTVLGAFNWPRKTNC